ncbi:MAG: hypothetical protein PUD50_02960 [Eubacteriales bacterium]|nr:hypothetical protein [Eubacteriales bacterium]
MQNSADEGSSLPDREQERRHCNAVVPVSQFASRRAAKLLKRRNFVSLFFDRLAAAAADSCPASHSKGLAGLYVAHFRKKRGGFCPEAACLNQTENLFFHAIQLDIGSNIDYTKKAVFMKVNIAVLGISVPTDAILM